MTSTRPGTVGELKASGYEPQSVRDELRRNLITKLKAGEDILPGIVGFDDTVIPMIVNAILARHDFILLGLRGQAKSRILRQLVNFHVKKAAPTKQERTVGAALAANATRQ